MNLIDIYKFSKSSKICENLVQFMKLKTEVIKVFATYGDSWISFSHCGDIIKTPEQYFYSKEEYIPNEYLEDGTKEINLVPDHVDTCLDIAMQMNKLFEIKHIQYTLSHLDKKPEEMIQFVSRIPAEKCNSIAISNRLFVKGQTSIVQVIDKTVLDYLMENLNFDAYLNLDCLFPEDYKHENLFKFRRFYQNNASWLTIDDLKSLRNAGNFRFAYTNFHTKDIIDFLKYFVNCEEDVIESIGIHMMDENSFSKDEVLSQFVTVPFFDLKLERQYHLIKVRNTKNRKRILAKMEFWRPENGIDLNTVEENGDYKIQLKILELMEEEIAVEKELRGVEELEEQIAENPSNEEEILEELMKRREAIQKVLAEIRNKLVSLNDELL